METIFMNTENSKTNETHKFVLNLLQRREIRSSNKRVALQTLSICYKRKNIRKLYESNKQKIIAPTGMMNLNCQMVTLCQIFKIIFNISLKRMKD